MMIVVLGSWEPFTKELTDIRKSGEDVGCNCKQMKLDKLIVVKLGQEVQHILPQKEIDSLSKSKFDCMVWTMSNLWRRGGTTDHFD
jgi:hypothetical protein